MASLLLYKQRFWKNDGSLNAGGKVYVYESGTSTPKTTYTTAAATVEHSHPIVLDAKGEADIFTTGTFKVNVTDSDDVQITGFPVDGLGDVLGGSIHSATAKTTPVDADEIPIWDSVALIAKKVTWANIKATLGSTFAALSGNAAQDFTAKKLTVSQTEGIVGTTTNNSAQTGSVGEYVESILVSGSAVSLTTGTAKTVTSISLTAGDWDVFGTVVITGSTNITVYVGSISTTTNTLGTVGDTTNLFSIATASSSSAVSPPTCRKPLSGTTTIYLVAQATFASGVSTAYGRISARRVR